MDSFNFNNLQFEKAKAIRKHRQLRLIANLFRFIEVFVVLFLVSRLSIKFPFTIKNSSEYFRDFSVSPSFIFVIGNVIVITLFAQSGQFSAQDSDTNKAGSSNLYHEFIQNSVKNQVIDPNENRIKNSEKQRIETVDTKTCLELKEYKRSQTENLTRVHSDKPRRVLRKSETEKCRKIIPSEKKFTETSYPEDCMSNDEFQKTVEAFIARQQRFQREEESFVF
ncbi:tRNA-methyltransferase non-catalytic subunit trm6MTase subunit [Quillaja saponaria]|uniref:tRNA-methyltransferase non-catalytic subunit trm6MTase subunit n=1 Tax=Quillaja saponaria TaxID=32244 RepID=A0AAD7QBJ0_QUISA|nr:tRNA-methyltransferase non-catalytic subunit trm6MTase subunit [Quillaja saponaria]